MTTLDKVIEMQRKGVPTTEITKTLRDEGINPQEIDDSLNQAQVKSAVYQDPSQQNQAPQNTAQTQDSQSNMQQSIMQPPQQNTAQAPPQPPAEQQYPEQAPPQQGEQYYYETPQSYPEDAYYAQQPAINTDTITEIIEQVIMEKFEEFKKKTGNIISFKNQAE